LQIFLLKSRFGMLRFAFLLMLIPFIKHNELYGNPIVPCVNLRQAVEPAREPYENETPYSGDLIGSRLYIDGREYFIPSAHELEMLPANMLAPMAQYAWQAAFRHGEESINSYAKIVSEDLISWIATREQLWDNSEVLRPFAEFQRPYTLPDGRIIYVKEEFLREEILGRWTKVFRPAQI